MQNDSTFDRRNFLAKLTALGVAGLVGSGSIDRGANTTADLGSHATLTDIDAEDFAKYVGHTFRIHRESGEPVVAQLIRVQPHHIVNEFRKPFSLMFRAQETGAVPHQIYSVEHAELGRFPMFLGAVGKPSSDVRLEAAFS